MSKSAYTDEEIKNVFQALFTEKKRLKELEQQLDLLRQQGSGTASAPDVNQALADENNKLKLLVANLKAKYQEAVNTPPPAPLPSPNDGEVKRLQATIHDLQNDNALLDEENRAFLKQLEQLKGLLRSTQENERRAKADAAAAQTALEAAKREAAAPKPAPVPAPLAPAAGGDGTHTEALREQNQILHNALVEAEEQNHRQKVRLEKLAQVIQEKEKRIHELHQYEFSHKKTAEQRLDLQSSLEEAHRERDTLQRELNESRQHAEQLERVIKFLRERSEEGQLTSKQFKEDFETSQETIKRLEKELHDAHEQLSAIKHNVVHLEHEKEELSEELKALQTQCDSLRRATTDTQGDTLRLEAALMEAEKIVQHEQENSLKLAEQLSRQTQAAENARKEIDIIKQALVRGMREANEMEARFKESVQEKVAALNKFHHARQQMEMQEKAMLQLREEMKQALAATESRVAHAQELCRAEEEAGRRALEEAQKVWEEERREALRREQQNNARFEEERQQLQGAHAAALEKLQDELYSKQEQHQRQTEELRREIGRLKQEIETAANVRAEKQALLEQYEALKSELNASTERLDDILAARQQLEQELQSLSTRCKEKERDTTEAQSQITRLLQEKQQLHDSLSGTRAEAEEKEAHIKMAQQHLAKKVKEAALMAEELEKSKLLVHDLQQQHVQHQIRTAELQASLDIHVQQEKKLQDQLAEMIKTYDSQVKKWEQKYFEMHDKWQATEIRKKELEKLEERHKQMQALLANIGSVLGGPPIVAAPPAPLPYEAPPRAPDPLPEAVEIEEAPTDEQPAKPYQNLFNMPKSVDKPRHNLFD